MEEDKESHRNAISAISSQSLTIMHFYNKFNGTVSGLGETERNKTTSLLVSSASWLAFIRRRRGTMFLYSDVELHVRIMWISRDIMYQVRKFIGTLKFVNNF